MKEIIIYHTNDMHARLSTTDDNNKSIGIDKISKLVNLTYLNNKATYWFDAGDLNGLPKVNLNHGKNLIELFNPTKINAMTIGNHDLNFGLDQLKQFSKQFRAYILSANTVYKDTKSLVFLPYKIYEVDINDNDLNEENSNNTYEDDIKIGVFGLSTPETLYKTNPKNVKDIEFLNPITVANNMVKMLSTTCDIIIAITHLGLDKSSEFTSEKLAKEVDGIDLIIDGHSHTILENGLTVNNTLIIQAGSYYNYLGKVTLQVNNKKIVNKESLLLTEEQIDKIIQQPDLYIDDKLNVIEQETDKLLNKTICFSPKHLSAERSLVRCKESELGNLFVSIIKNIANTDLAILNGGNLRSELPEGNITYKDIYSIFPFEGTIKIVEINKQVIKEMLEHSVEFIPAAFGGFLNIAGLTFKFNSNLSANNRIIEINNIEENKIYTMALPDFLQQGGDDYTMLKNLKVIKDLGQQNELIINYLSEYGINIDYSLGRILL